ncbi:MAG: hydrogenase maturation nickel metallochaperone HypA [Candidatus Methylophosphatis roskildensis]
MHEMSLAEGVLQIVEEAAREQGFTRVRAIRLEIGQLSSVEVEALRFCFDAVTRATLAEGARLEIDTVPGAGWCMMCSASVPLPALYEACPRCGGYQVQPTAGTEMRVKDLEVD